MIELNLLPEELKKKKKRIELPEIPIIPIVIGLVLFLVVLQLLLSGIIYAGRNQLAALKETWKDLEPKKKRMDDIKRTIAATNKKTQAIEALMAERLLWSRILNELSNSLSDNIWFTELTFEERAERQMPPRAVRSDRKGGVAGRAKPVAVRVRDLSISGYAAGRGEEATTYVAQFIRALKNNPEFFRDFDEVELISIRKGSVAGQDVMNFTLVCRFREEA